MPLSNCCYKCQDRFLGCHCTCEKYSEEVKKNNERYVERLKRNQISNDISAVRKTSKSNKRSFNSPKRMHKK